LRPPQASTKRTLNPHDVTPRRRAPPSLD
jgi:hypothetical protein